MGGFRRHRCPACGQRHRCPACGRRMYHDHSAATNASSSVDSVVGLVCVNVDCAEFGITVQVVSVGTTRP